MKVNKFYFIVGALVMGALFGYIFLKTCCAVLLLNRGQERDRNLHRSQVGGDYEESGNFIERGRRSKSTLDNIAASS